MHQLVSTVRARSRRPLTALDVVQAAFPAGSMTGAPKHSAMTILHELEQGPRGVYSGAFGYLGVDGSADLAMVIRSIVLDADGREHRHRRRHHRALRRRRGDRGDARQGAGAARRARRGIVRRGVSRLDVRARRDPARPEDSGNAPTRHTIESHVAHDHDPAHAETGAYDFAAIQAKWLPVWDELAAVPRRACRATRGRASTSSTCSRTRRATCTWATPRRSASATSSRGTGASRASTCCTPSAGTRSACPPRTRRSSAASTRANGPTRTSRSRSARSASTRRRSTGAASCTRATPSTTSGTSGCS